MNTRSYHLPPVDVIMVWHTYLLNPGYVTLVIAYSDETKYCSWYAEDTNRIPQLAALSAFNEHLTMNMVRG